MFIDYGKKGENEWVNYSEPTGFGAKPINIP
jgi:hypothetical protein